MKDFKINIIDRYIIKKFLGTFFFALLLIIVIAVVFDFSEKVDDFLEKNAPAKAIIFDYYMNFIPNFAVLFSSLFTFISVIFFTSKMAYNTEIIAILSSGRSFRRMLYPYLISAGIISAFSFFLSNFVIPNANKVRLEFEEMYIRNHPYNFDKRNVHKQISPGVYVFMESFSNSSDMGYKFSLEKFENGKLRSKLMAEYIRWDTTKRKWNLQNYYIRNLNGIDETIVKGESTDTTINMYPEEFKRRDEFVETMNLSDLNKYIKEIRTQGSDNISTFIIEKHKRMAYPISTFILTMIGVTLSSRKVRGGIGMQLGLGLGLSFGYILFMQFSAQFAISGTLSPFLAAWVPNFIFIIISVILYKLAPK
ncbi:MAG TPA: LptF/LptG family permease [Bacteroidales bacterium]|nr:LptF/LptG family permease [Bacteroidales bacterium]